ncbi:hypothetical protein KAT92_03275 [Candidatus Babeliales bacterium]|nr:hypothetical protein [Candidatus Babeliales bacterium]
MLNFKKLVFVAAVACSIGGAVAMDSFLPPVTFVDPCHEFNSIAENESCYYDSFFYYEILGYIEKNKEKSLYKIASESHWLVDMICTMFDLIGTVYIDGQYERIIHDGGMRLLLDKPQDYLYANKKEKLVTYFTTNAKKFALHGKKEWYKEHGIDMGKKAKIEGLVVFSKNPFEWIHEWIEYRENHQKLENSLEKTDPRYGSTEEPLDIWDYYFQNIFPLHRTAPFLKLPHVSALKFPSLI